MPDHVVSKIMTKVKMLICIKWEKRETLKGDFSSIVVTLYHWLQGHNIVFISNHQTEADPAVIALLLEATHPRIAENMVS